MTDVFTLGSGGSWLGTLNGGSGLDRLSAFPGVNVWVTSGPTAGTLNTRRFLGIEIRA